MIALWENALQRASVKETYLVASTFRSGSTYFSAVIRAATDWPTVTQETLNSLAKLSKRQDGSFSQELVKQEFQKILQNTVGGVFSTKIMWPHRNQLARILEIDRKNSTRFKNVFPCAEWFFVYRNDLFAQAISFWRAKVSGRWHVYKRSTEDEPLPEYDFQSIEACYRELCSHEALWKDFFRQSGIHPIEILYEEVLSKGENYLIEKLGRGRISEHFKRPLTTEVPLKRQHDAHSLVLRDRFLSDLYSIGR